ncbi:MAG: CaiB/BaiF CoA-transferase family protein, partial [Alphaproteobacteria bacterium]|nr:CaiB/BaiF CoA-transferase family protein [Alphaproteobacteria bacterium]
MTMLDGIRVLSFNHFLLGPMGMQVLGDLGADVIAVEPVSGGFQRKWSGANRRADGESLLHLCANRNKRNIAIDLKSEEGKEIVHRLIAKSDVICENFRPGVMDKFGFGYEDAKKINAGVIYASASGYGGDGPYRERPGQDLVVQAMSGLAMINGNDQQAPVPVGVS